MVGQTEIKINEIGGKLCLICVLTSVMLCVAGFSTAFALKIEILSLLSGIAIAYLKIIKYFKIFAHVHIRKARKRKRDLAKLLFFVFFECARRQIFLVFKALAIFRPLSNEILLWGALIISFFLVTLDFLSVIVGLFTKRVGLV